MTLPPLNLAASSSSSLSKMQTISANGGASGGTIDHESKSQWVLYVVIGAVVLFLFMRR